MDGMVSSVLQDSGKITTGVDRNSEKFDERAVQEGIKLLKMDASNLQFENDSFDFVFSYSSFEHFDKPEIVLKEALRVVRDWWLYLSRF